jgi:hypothetical protein
VICQIPRRTTEGRQAHDLFHSLTSALPDTATTPPNLREPTISREPSVHELPFCLQGPRTGYSSDQVNHNVQKSSASFRDLSTSAGAAESEHKVAPENQYRAVSADYRRTAVDDDHSEISRRLGHVRKRMEYTISQDMTINDAARRKATLSALGDREAARCTKNMRHIFKSSCCETKRYEYTRDKQKREL